MIHSLKIHVTLKQSVIHQQRKLDFSRTTLEACLESTVQFFSFSVIYYNLTASFISFKAFPLTSNKT